MARIEVEIDLEDILDQIDDDDLEAEVERRAKKMRKRTNQGKTVLDQGKTVLDQIKAELISDAMERFTLQELEERLK